MTISIEWQRRSQQTIRRRRIVRIFCIAVALFLWGLLAPTFLLSRVYLGQPSSFPLSDWTVYYAGAKLALAGRFPLLFDAARFTAYQQHLVAPLGLAALPFAPWLYPPIWLLVLLPFASLPFAWSCAVFEGLSLAGAAGAFGWQRGRIAWRRVLALVAAPAACATAFTGQNAFLSVALLAGGMRLVGRQPVLAGVLFGLLAYKPQLGLMIPFALVALRAWRALLCAALTVVLFCAASLLAFGLAPWRLWLDLALHPGAHFVAAWLRYGFLAGGFSADVCARLAGAPPAVADALQAAVALAAGGAVYYACRRPYSDRLRLAALFAATSLASPHLQTYDLLLVAAAAIIAYEEFCPRGLSLGELAILGSAWILPEVRPWFTPLGFVAPFVMGALLLLVLRRGAAPAGGGRLLPDPAGARGAR